MREPAIDRPVFGLMAEFDSPERLVDGVKHLREAGFSQIDTYTPFPVEELVQALSIKDQRVPLLTLIGGVVGILGGFGMQVYANVDFAIDIGDRPMVPPQGFMLITFELLVLSAVTFCIFGMLVLNHLPKLHHPVFNVPRFQLATSDKFFLVVFSTDEKFDPVTTRSALEGLSPVHIDLVRGGMS